MSEWVSYGRKKIITVTDACVLRVKNVVGECVLRFTILDMESNPHFPS